MSEFYDWWKKNRNNGGQTEKSASSSYTGKASKTQVPEASGSGSFYNAWKKQRNKELKAEGKPSLYEAKKIKAANDKRNAAFREAQRKVRYGTGDKERTVVNPYPVDVSRTEENVPEKRTPERKEGGFLSNLFPDTGKKFDDEAAAAYRAAHPDQNWNPYSAALAGYEPQPVTGRYISSMSPEGPEFEALAALSKRDENARSKTYEEFMTESAEARATGKDRYDAAVLKGRTESGEILDRDAEYISKKQRAQYADPFASKATRPGAEKDEVFKGRGLLASDDSILQNAMMTDEQKETYYYLYGTEGAGAAENFRRTALDAGDNGGINAEIAAKAYETGLKNAEGIPGVVGRSAASFISGAKGAVGDIAGTVNMLSGDEQYRPTGVSEYYGAYIVQDAPEGSIEKTWYELMQNAGNNAVALAAGMTFGPAVGSFVFASQAGSRAYNESLREGHSVQEAQAYGLMQAADEEITNYLLGGIQAYGGGALQKTLGKTKAAKAISREVQGFFKTEAGKAFARGLMDALARGGGEAAQEYVQHFSEQLEQWIAYGGVKDYNLLSEEGRENLRNTVPSGGEVLKAAADPDALHEAFLGFANAMLMNAPGQAANIADIASRGSNSTIGQSEDTRTIHIPEINAEAGAESEEDYRAALQNIEAGNDITWSDETGEHELKREDNGNWSHTVRNGPDIMTTESLSEEEAAVRLPAGRNVTVQDSAPGKGYRDFADTIDVNPLHYSNGETYQAAKDLRRMALNFAERRDRGERIGIFDRGLLDRAADDVLVRGIMDEQGRQEPVWSQPETAFEEADSITGDMPVPSGDMRSAEVNRTDGAVAAEEEQRRQDLREAAAMLGRQTAETVADAYDNAAVGRSAAVPVQEGEFQISGTSREVPGRNDVTVVTETPEEVSFSHKVNLGTNGNKALISNMTDSIPADVYQEGFVKVYRAARYRQNSRSYLNDYAVGMLTEAQVSAAYEAGIHDRNEDNRKRTVKTGQKRRGGFDEKNSFAGISPEGRRFADVIGKATGTRVIIVERLVNSEGKTANAAFDQNTNTFIFSMESSNNARDFGHESGHFIRLYAPELFQELQDMAYERLDEKEFDIDAVIRRKMEEYGTNDIDMVNEEIVSDMLRDLPGDEYEFERFINEHKTLAEKIVSFFEDILDAIRSVFTTFTGDEMIQVLQGEEEFYSRFADKYYEALGKAAERSRAGETVDRTERASLKEQNQERNYSLDVSADSEQAAGGGNDHQKSGLYSRIIAKPDIEVYNSDELGLARIMFDGKATRTEIINAVRDNIKRYNTDKGRKVTNDWLYNNDLRQDISIPAIGLKHGMLRMRSLNVEAFENLPNIVENAIVVNEADGNRKNADKTFVMFGAYKGRDSKIHIARLIVNHYEGKFGLEEVNVLYSIRAKKEGAALDGALGQHINASKHTPSIIKISQLIEGIKTDYPDMLPQDILDHFGIKRSNGVDIKGLRFSLKDPAEQGRNLIAVHNLSEEKLYRLMKYSGNPMPSIAVTKASQGWNKFGDISFVFGKDTIAPEADRRNKVYGADAWTPTVPKIEYELDDKVFSRARKYIAETAGSRIPSDMKMEAERFVDRARESLEQNDMEDTVDKAMRTDAMKAVFFASQGIETKEITKEVREGGVPEATRKAFDQVIQAFGEDADHITEYPLKSVLDAHDGAVRKAFTELQRSRGKSDEAISRMLDKSFVVSHFVKALDDYLVNGGEEKVSRVRDTEAMRKQIDERLDEEAYKAWVRNIFSGSVIGEGIWNGKQMFTASGNRRSFKQLHMPVTAENMVKAMLSTTDDVRNTVGYMGIKSIRAVAVPEFRNVQELRKSSEKIQLIDGEEWDHQIDELNTRMYNRLSKIVAASGMDQNIMAASNVGEIVLDAARKRRFNEDTVRQEFRKYPAWKVTDADIRDITNIVNIVTEMPVDMFEAKPQRVVGFREAGAAIVPKDASERTVNWLKDQGIPTYFYERGNSEQRTEIMNMLDDLKFSLVESTEQAERMSSKLRDINERLADEKSGARQVDAYMLSEEDVRKELTKILKEMNADDKITGYDLDTFTKQVMTLNRLTMETTRHFQLESLQGIARSIAREAMKKGGTYDDSMAESYPGLREDLKNYRLTIGIQDRADLKGHGYNSYFDFMAKTRGMLTIDNKNGTPVDKVYVELNERFPNLFPEDITHPADQLAQIANVAESLKPKLVNEFEDEDEVAAYFGNRILETYFKAGSISQKRFDSMMEEYRKEMRREYNERLKKADAYRDEQIRKVREDAQHDILVNEKAWMNYVNMLEGEFGRTLAMKELELKAKADKARMRKLDSEARDRLLSAARQLARMKGGPEFEAEKQALIGNLDLVAKGIASRTVKKIQGIKAEVDRQKAIDPDFQPTPTQQAAINRLSEVHISELSGKELADLTDLVVSLRNSERTFQYEIRKSNARRISDIGRAWVNQNHELRGVNVGSMSDALNTYWLNTLNSKRAFRMFSGYRKNAVLMDLWEQLNEGQHRQMMFQMEAEKMFTPVIKDAEFVRTLFDHTVTIRDSVGRTAMITPAMRISIYLHSKNAHNMAHIATGGFIVPNAKLYKAGKYSESYGQGAVKIRLTAEEVRGIISEMTPAELEFAKVAETFFNVTTKAAINETSMQLDGYEKAKVDHYFPIKSDPDFTHRDVSGLKMDGTIEGAGYLKERNEEAKNPIYLEDVTQVLERQIRNTGMYYGLAVPLRNFNKVYGWTASQFEDSVQRSFRAKWGSKGTAYIEKVLRDLQGGSNKTQDASDWSFNKLLSGARGNFAGAVLTLNPSVAMKQAASYPTAAARLGWNPLIKAIRKIGYRRERDLELIDRFTPLLWYRSIGQSDAALAEVAKRKNKWQQSTQYNKVRDMMNWIQNIDVRTVKTLWYASEYYVDDNFRQYRKGSEAYYQKVAEVFNEVVEDTQPNYTVLQRPSILRTENELAKSLFMFKTQPLQNLGLVYDSLQELKVLKEEMKHPYAAATATGKAFENARKQYHRALASITVSTVVFTMMTAAAGALLHRMDPFRDEETGEITPESFAVQSAWSAGSSIAGMLPLGSEIYSFLEAKIRGKRVYDLSVAGVDQINTFVSRLSSLVDMIVKTVSDEALPAGAKARKIGISTARMAAALSTLYGIPADNASKIAEAIAKHIEDFPIKGNSYGPFGQFEAGSSITAGQRRERVYRALMEYGIDSEEFEEALEDAREKTGKEDKDLFASGDAYDRAYEMYKIYGKDSEEYRTMLQFLKMIGKKEKNIENAIKDRIEKDRD